MNILGIDYGRKKIGLAISDSKIAQPFSVIRFNSINEAMEKIKKVISSLAEATKDKQITRVIIGISEGEMAKETKEFGKSLKKTLNLPITYQDETLSTQEAQRLSIEANISRKKRREFEDAYTAAVILQNYLDNL
jgi:putative Holliday junction resolvase